MDTLIITIMMLLPPAAPQPRPAAGAFSIDTAALRRIAHETALEAFEDTKHLFPPPLTFKELVGEDTAREMEEINRQCRELLRRSEGRGRRM